MRIQKLELITKYLKISNGLKKEETGKEIDQKGVVM
jgi:hypothetical protein